MYGVPVRVQRERGKCAILIGGLIHNREMINELLVRLRHITVVYWLHAGITPIWSVYEEGQYFQA